MKLRLLQNKIFIVVMVDALLITVSLYLAYLTRFDFSIPAKFISGFQAIIVLVITIKLACCYFFDLYRGMWRYTSISDLLNVIKAACVSTLIISFFILLKYRFIGFSRSVFIIDWCFTIFFVAGIRLIVRVLFESRGDQRTMLEIFKSLIDPMLKKLPGARNLLIIGAGDCGEKILREIKDNAKLKYNVVGFLDDDYVKVGRKIHRVPVLATIGELRAAARKSQAEEALIAIPSANSKDIRRIVNICKESGLIFKTVPGMGELIDGKITINAIREVAFRDLLGREVIKLEEERIGAYLKNKRVLVTGAGGSIGSELCRQICRFEPESLLLYERAESPLYAMDLELKQLFNNIKIVSILADVQIMSQLEKAFDKYSPQIVFHAAAYKHVPMLEKQPWKAIENNVIGTHNLIDIATKSEVSRFVFVSTDKAVRPVNVMGASKRLAEMLINGQNNCNVSNTKFMIVRFGNVVGSVGSVVPLFKKQIAGGGPVTVTHPDVTRFFMTIPEACQLILQAGAMGKGGEIYLLDMGVPIKIDDLARDLIRLSGYEPEVDIPIEYIGLRPGEKLFEELITADENIVPTGHEKIMALKGMECNLDLLNGKIEELTRLAEIQLSEEIKLKLKEILPEYNPL